MTERLERLHGILDAARAEVRKVVIGQERAVDMALVTVLCRQHALIEGVPGVGKTLMARTLAAVLGCEFNRIQFTPDLMPADITGTSVFHLATNQFVLQRGPVFTTFLLADEINRAPAKTQSALLQAMQERVVTIDRETLALPDNFTVFATQNPIEFEGTYPLPEAQKDRFMLKIAVAWPEKDEEDLLARRMVAGDEPEKSLAQGTVRAVLQAGSLSEARLGLADVTFRDELISYVVEVVRRTRLEESVLVGASPRATQGLLAASRAHAALAGRDFVTPDDVKRMAVPVLEHRLIIRPEFEVEGVTAQEAIGRILEAVTVPS
jgi:MoxR-like ATPase